MIKGRRTRNAAKVPKPLADDTASPKRKDFKYRDSNDNASEHVDKIPSKHIVEPMKLRGGRLKTIEISQYLQPSRSKSNYDALDSNALLKMNHPKHIIDENACDSFEGQSSNTSDLCLNTKVKNNMRQENETLEYVKYNPKNNNNIFLQEPVLSLNLANVSTTPNRTLMIMHNTFLTTPEIKRDLFTSPSQPKIDSLWKGVTTTTNNKCIEHQPETSINSPDHHILDLSKPTQVTQVDSTTTTAMESLLHEESNSCDSGDSGVVILSGPEGNATSSVPLITQPKLSVIGDQSNSAEKRKKPTTPHRILCPSPVKNAIVFLQSPSGLLKSSSLKSSNNSRRVGVTRKRLDVQETSTISIMGRENTAIDEVEAKQQNPGEVNDALRDKQANAARNIDSHTKNSQKSCVPVYSKSHNGGSKKITEYYPIRRSVRKTKKEVQVERDQDIERAIRDQREEGLKIKLFDGKGRGIVTTRPFSKGEFVVEYIGDLISVSEAKQREQIYAKDDNTGCYMYYFRHKNLQHCIDATAESGKLGRLVNHSRNGNLLTKTVPLNNRPHLVLIAKEDIDVGVEVTYDYGDRSKEALQHHPWLAL
ncbi:histone-lysine N-methyltransferase PR-Set7 [Anopheles nili]|uniref:histone-lysine N-methyltransferase PR-Set7 n=1 Tax=Anopheles nili TaxID=185578 RepID=UPI00237B2C2A|nr:histone-lysine N-methyltransferase PR-Set7 [Anopheles nili]